MSRVVTPLKQLLASVQLHTRMTTMLHLILALTIFCSVIGTSLSAPLQVGPVKRDLKDRFDDILQLLADKKALSMAIGNNFFGREISQQGSKSWKYPPRMETEGELSPSETAARRHFEVSEPGTGPILNHPLGKGARKKLKAVVKLIKLLSEVN